MGDLDTHATGTARGARGLFRGGGAARKLEGDPCRQLDRPPPPLSSRNHRSTEVLLAGVELQEEGDSRQPGGVLFFPGRRKETEAEAEAEG